MAIKYTEEQLNTIDKSLLVQMFLNQQEQLETLTTQVRSLNEKMQLMMEQLVLSNRNRFGRSSEKLEDVQQISFMEVDGNIVFFNEAEAVCDLDAPEPEDLKAGPAKQGKQKVVLCQEKVQVKSELLSITLAILYSLFCHMCQLISIFLFIFIWRQVSAMTVYPDSIIERLYILKDQFICMPVIEYFKAV